MSRPPKQARTRERVVRILDAAHEILVAEGYDALTVRRITEVAELPVGTVYQFFADKEAIESALVLRYLSESEAIIETRARDLEAASWSEAVDSLFDSYVALYRATPGLLVLWQARHLSAAMLAADAAGNERLALGLRRLLVSIEGVKDNAELLRACRVVVEMADALLDLAFRSNVRGDAKLIIEAKRALRPYLADTIERLPQNAKHTEKRRPR